MRVVVDNVKGNDFGRGPEKGFKPRQHAVNLTERPASGPSTKGLGIGTLADSLLTANQGNKKTAPG